MPLLCYCFWPSLRASSILLCQQFLTWFMHAILRLFCAHDIVFSQFCPSLSLSSSLYLPAVMCCNYITKSFSTELLGSRWQILGIGGGEGTWLGFRKGRLMVCSTDLSSGCPTSICNFGTAHQIVLYWRHLTSTATLLGLWCHTEDLNSQFVFKLKVLLTYPALYLCQQRNGRQCQKSFQKLTQSSVKLRLVSIVVKKMEVRVSTV